MTDFSASSTIYKSKLLDDWATRSFSAVSEKTKKSYYYPDNSAKCKGQVENFWKQISEWICKGTSLPYHQKNVICHYTKRIYMIAFMGNMHLFRRDNSTVWLTAFSARNLLLVLLMFCLETIFICILFLSNTVYSYSMSEKLILNSYWDGSKKPASSGNRSVLCFPWNQFIIVLLKHSVFSKFHFIYKKNLHPLDFSIYSSVNP